MSTEKNVYQRIHAVMNDLKTITKNGRNDFHKYDYATEADFVHAMRPLLEKHGLVVVPTLAYPPQVLDGGITNLAIKFTIVNIDKPEEKVEAVIPAQGADKGDKGVYKALTGAKKYFLAMTFMAATGDDPEADGKAVVTKDAGATATTAAATNGRKPSFRKNVTTPTAAITEDDI